MAIKVTFTLDEATIERLRQTAVRLGQPKSAVVRAAIRDYHSASDRLGEIESRAMLRALDRYAAQPPTGSEDAMRKEMAEVRAARRAGGRGHTRSKR